MKHTTAVGLALFLLAACQHEPEIALAWPRSDVTYRAFLGSPRTDDDFRAKALELARETGSLPRAEFVRRAADLLRSVAEPDEMDRIASLSPASPGRLRLEVREPESGTDGLQREAPTLSAEIDESGEALSFYLSREQHALAVLAFQLPRDPVRVGESWDVPATLTELSGGYRAEAPFRRSFATLLAVGGTEAEPIAKVLYTAVEAASGELRLGEETSPLPFNCDLVYLGYGELDVRAGRWRTYKGRLVAEGDGAADMIQRDLLLALQPSTS